jgi:hypothetical protein
MIIPVAKEIGDLMPDSCLMPNRYWQAELLDIRLQAGADEQVSHCSSHDANGTTYHKSSQRYCGLRSGGSTPQMTLSRLFPAEEKTPGDIQIPWITRRRY